MRIFNDPKGIFSIVLPSTWLYNEKSDTDKQALHQFAVSPDCIFQISCNPLNERISEIIASNKLAPHDFSLPNVSFVEKFQTQFSFEMYSWMCLIEDQFFHALYFYKPQSKDRKSIGPELSEIRMALQNIRYHNKKKKAKKNPGRKAKKNYFDINNWRDKPKKFFDSTLKIKKFKVDRISPLQIDVVKLYALLKCKVSHQPNGFFTLVSVRAYS